MGKIKTEDSIGMQFGAFMDVFRKHIIHKFAKNDLGITLQQFSLLHILKTNDSQILSDLSQLMDIDKSAVMRFIDSLENKRLVARINDPEDGRKKILVLTHAGMEKLKEAEIFFDMMMKDITSSIKKDDLKVFGSVLNQMGDNIKTKQSLNNN